MQSFFKQGEQSLEYLKQKGEGKKAIVLLHGYGANMNDLFGLASYLDEKKEYDFICPNGLLTLEFATPYEGRAWFPIDMQELEKFMRSGEFRDFSSVNPAGLSESLNLLKSFLEKLCDEYQEVILGGFSQGAMLASLLLLEFENKINKAILFSGNLLSATSFEGKNLSHLHFIQSHGTQDPVLGIAGAKTLYEKLKSMQAHGEFIEFFGGHEIPLAVINRVKNFLLS